MINVIKIILAVTVMIKIIEITKTVIIMKISIAVEAICYYNIYIYNDPAEEEDCHSSSSSIS